MQKTRNYYSKLLETKRDYKIIGKSVLQSFLFGGLLCLTGQGILDILEMNVAKNDASLYLSCIMILFAGILTAVGIYDEIGQMAKSGLAIPITGFANACVSSAMEYHKEGIVLGIGSNCLKLAGSVIVLGTTSALIITTIRYIFGVLL